MKKSIIALAGLLTIVGCASSSPIGLVDINRVTSNWTEFQTDQNHLYADEQRIAASKASNAQKASQVAALQKKYGALTVQLTDQIRAAAAKVAAKKHLKLVLTREGVGYGGTDITAEVEKDLGITETASPKPSGL
ncbi:MAG: hypothetical protein HKL92_02230 [Candidatus Eremiobacteraeota bacterium]|nr:hypothetical protein [Candidatus Eremiobacteraeota bacterium]NNM92140.1 hypothetical protein [Candidatus Eremiobacteraeota bacterium]